MFHQKIGVLGSGQLGRMLYYEALKMNIDLSFYGPMTGPMNHHQVVGSLDNEEQIWDFGKNLDILTIEIENIPINVLEKLEDYGVKIYPTPQNLKIIKNKIIQKKSLEKLGFSVGEFQVLSGLEIKNLKQGKKVIKAAEGGHDGRAVWVVDFDEENKKQKNDFTFLCDKKEYLVENFVNFQKELAIMVARNSSGETKVYDAVEMVFDSETNQLHYLLAPAQISSKIELQIKRLGLEVANSLKFIGVLALECFLIPNGDLLINELAPRPHNSYHHSLDACETSQFEQCLRAILNLPLGSTHFHSYALCLNLIGEGEGFFEKNQEDILKILGFPHAKVHVYGKTKVRKNRKMGHATLLARNMDDLLSLKEEFIKCHKIRNQ